MIMRSFFYVVNVMTSNKCINNSFVQNSPLVIIGSKMQPIS
jgi:hypothetical protein